jgi:hypothetical protein
LITNVGKSILGKYLLGQTTSYASHIAIGCGKKPLNLLDATPNTESQERLEFEMIRVPVSSRGIVSEGGNTQIVLTGELPSEERYEITEVGIFSSGSNPSAGAYDSKTVFGFTNTENWSYYNGTSSIDIPKVTERLDSETSLNVINVSGKIDINNGNSLSSDVPVFETNADNSVFYDSGRLSRYERARFFNNVILLRGDTSNLTQSGGNFANLSASNYIQYPNKIASFSQNSPNDELKLALSIINKSGTTPPDKVWVLVNFVAGTEYARFQVEMVNGSSGYDFDENRYYVVTKKLQDLYTSSSFNWDNVTKTEIYANVLVSNVASDQYYVGLDALRLENISTPNPLYGLTGYTIIKTSNSLPVVKSTNTSNYIEFRFNIEAT